MDKQYKEKSFLGNGFSFPIEVSRISGRVEESSAEKNIEQSIRIILSTQRGERVMKPEFGCNLRGYAFSEMNYTVLSEIEMEVKNALVLWEPRITDIRVRCHEDNSHDGVLLIDIFYVVRSTNNPYNIVYPFYLNESV